jgi:hypothetical protein
MEKACADENQYSPADCNSEPFHDGLDMFARGPASVVRRDRQFSSSRGGKSPVSLVGIDKRDYRFLTNLSTLKPGVFGIPTKGRLLPALT